MTEANTNTANVFVAFPVAANEDCKALSMSLQKTLGFFLSIQHLLYGEDVFDNAPAYPGQRVLRVKFRIEVDVSRFIHGILGPPAVEVKEEVLGGAISSTRLVPGLPTSNVLLKRKFVTVVMGQDTKEFTEDQFTLLWAAFNGKLVLVTGTGVTRSISGDPRSLWGGFLKSLSQCVWPNTAVGTFNNGVFASLQADPHAQSEYLLFCAERDGLIPRVTSHTLQIMSALIPNPTIGTTNHWNAALRDFKGKILTFNYDIALEIAIGRSPKDLADLKAHTQLEHYVVHLHGVFTDDDSIVLKQQTYIDAAKVVPGYMASLADSGCVFLYAGVNGVLSDPDLAPFWRYEQVHHTIGKNRPTTRNHFVIADLNTNPPYPIDSLGNAMSFFRKVSYVDHGEIPGLVGRIVAGVNIHQVNIM